MKIVRFDFDRKGRPIAFEWAPRAGRWLRCSIAGARLDVATGAAGDASTVANASARVTRAVRNGASREEYDAAVAAWRAAIADAAEQDPRPCCD